MIVIITQVKHPGIEGRSYSAVFPLYLGPSAGKDLSRRLLESR